MTVYIGLLRAVNVAGSNLVGMGALRDFLNRRGYTRVQTLLQSGNVVFHHEAARPEQLERRLEAMVLDGLGLKTDFFVRSTGEWRTLVAENPFSAEARADPQRLIVTVLKQAPAPDAWAALQAAIRGREQVRGSGRQAYIVYPDGVGRSHLTPALIEAKLGTRGTSRNWNTVGKLERLASAEDSSS
ncbi:MAG: DUF1697 domain-containing protein [Thermoplasmata archaeon]|nr:DUF1697 domain-containing protein [Thermoplasmata archaeon]